MMADLIAAADSTQASLDMLRRLVDSQQDQIARLKTENDGLLAKYEAVQRQHQHHLGQALLQVSEANQAIQSSLSAKERKQQESVEAFHAHIGELRRVGPAAGPNAGSGTATEPAGEQAGRAAPDSDAALDDCDDPQVLKAKLKEMQDALARQHRSNEKLQTELNAERNHVATLRADITSLKQMAVNVQASAEMEEEFISNMLLKRIQELQREKGDLLLRVEAEEEMITNQLQKKLQQLQRDKIEMEIALEKEQEFMVNRLQKQLEDLRARVSGPGSLSVSTSSKKWPYPHSSSSSMSELTSPTIGPAPGVVEVLKAEVNATKLKLQETEKGFEEWSQRTCGLYNQLRQVAMALARGETQVPLSAPFALHLPAAAAAAAGQPTADPSATATTAATTSATPSTPPVIVRPITADTIDESFPSVLVPIKCGTPDTTTPATTASTTAASSQLSTPQSSFGAPGGAGLHRSASLSRSSVSHRSPSASPIIGHGFDPTSLRSASRTIGNRTPFS
ncbi:hypothetical protein BC831DRAFT_468106 [Entophlyctis helioformis]|nr:hypothetical protein BC831DRAFT_468106 [Entophlyctis helioformis]